MNDRNLDQLLTAWMDLGPTAAPGRVADAARLEAASTLQTAIPMWWPPRRFPVMNMYAKVALATAAVVAAALIGYSYLIAPYVGGPSLFLSEPTPSPTPAAMNFTALEGGGAELAPGPYRIDYAAPIDVIVTIPDETFLGYLSAWYKALYDWGPWHQSNLATLGVMDVKDLAENPCSGEFGQEADLGTDVDTLADAFEQVAGIAVERSDASLDGYSGVLLDVSATERPADCVDEPMLLLTNHDDVIPAPDVDPEVSMRIWILDVDGERLVLVGSSSVQAYVDDVQGLIDSIQIEAP
jgi:hypothetical protein